MLKINKKTLTIAISAAIVAAGTSTVHAAGFQLKEQSAEGQGNSFAGQTAKAVDASTIFFNPAGMARLEGNQVQGNLSYIAPKFDYNHGSDSISAPFPANPFTDSSGIDGGVSAAVPALYGVWDYSEKVNFGLSLNVPYGLSTEYDDDWVGSEYNILSEVTALNLAASASYRINDQLSVGGSLQVQRTEGKLSSNTITGLTTSAVTTLEADDIGYGFGIGVLYEYSDKGRIGFNYRSEIDHKLDGDVTTPGISSFDAHADFTTPASASIGIYHEVSDKWALLGDISWTDWSVFEELAVIRKADGVQVQTTEFNFSDTVFVAVGANYQYSDKLQLKFGIAYDEGAVDDENRTAGVPDASRIWTSIGATYKMNKQTTLNAGFSHINASSAKISETGDGAAHRTSFDGDYDSSANILTVGFNYQF